jgi:hypothetical protein
MPAAAGGAIDDDDDDLPSVVGRVRYCRLILYTYDTYCFYAGWRTSNPSTAKPTIKPIQVYFFTQRTYYLRTIKQFCPCFFKLGISNR